MNLTQHRWVVISLITASVLFGSACKGLAQVIVDGKNLNEDKTIEYIQLNYYIDRTSLLPVYLIDFGLNSGKEDVNLTPKIQVNSEFLSYDSPVAVLNKLYRAGWEYLGDHLYLDSNFERLHMYTLKRKSQP